MAERNAGVPRELRIEFRIGIHVGDVFLAIGGKKISSEDDLRQAIFKIGPGKTQYSYRRSGDTKTVAVDCASCKVE